MQSGEPTSAVEAMASDGATRLAGRVLATAAIILAGFLNGTPLEAASNKVRISGLADVSFGTIGSLTTDAVQSQSLCLFADTAISGYNVTAAGEGPGGAFRLASGASSMSFEVQWNSAAGRASGTSLNPNVPLTGQSSGATQQTCNNGPATSASLIVILPAAALSSAVAGTYKGSLTLLVGAE